MARIDFQNLGRIAAGAIEPAQLTVLVGKNNTGKSYVATLIWALTQLSNRFSFEHTLKKRPGWWTAFISEVDKAKAAELVVNAEMQEELTEYVNKALESGVGEYLNRIFAFSGFSDTKVQINPTVEFTPFTVSISTIEMNESERGLLLLQGSIIENDRKEVTFRYRLPAQGRARSGRAAERLFEEMVCRSAFGSGWYTLRGALFIPAARTGLMLAFRSLVAQSLDRGLEEGAVTLPEPMTEFLRRLTFNFPYPKNAKRAEIARWIEGEILHGNIETTEDDIPQFSYTSRSHSTAIPLHATSSMITEVAPFLLALRNRSIDGLIIFEEPEAHLHLSAQRDMARAIARLLNSGTKILLTTHSDTFIQQLNNLMAIYAHNNRQELQKGLGYKEDDLINPDSVRAYEFIENGDKTEISEVERDGPAFAVRSLNETLVSLARETISLHEES